MAGYILCCCIHRKVSSVSSEDYYRRPEINDGTMPSITHIQKLVRYFHLAGSNSINATVVLAENF